MNNIKKLFSENYIEAFNEGIASLLVSNRNTNIGSMFSAERSIYYIQILLRMLFFRREHELEPLNDELYNSVRVAQECYSDNEYTVDMFNHDIQQLFDWKLIERRIERERLRGYKDVSRQKFRFRLNEETVSFLSWLEERLSRDIESDSEDTRNLLLDVAGRLKEASKELYRISFEANISDSNGQILRIARTVIYNISCLKKLTFSISRQLNDLNAELLFFLVKNYNIEEAKKAISLLDFYSGSYLSHIYSLRNEILDYLDQLISSEESISKINFCNSFVNEEYSHFPSTGKVSRHDKNPVFILKNMLDFYSDTGKLDSICERINRSAMKVWGKLNAHLRELERSNTRLEDLENRLYELSTLGEDEVPENFFMELLAPAYMKYDPNYWDDHEKANPPVLKRYSKHHTKIPGKYKPQKDTLPEKKNFISVEQAKLNELQNWINAKLPDFEDEISISNGCFTDIADLRKIIELIKAGYLGKGKKLNNICLKLDFNNNSMIQTKVNNMTLTSREIKLKK